MQHIYKQKHMTMENQKSLSNEESFEVISRMIRTAQHDLSDQSFYYLIWGWLVLAASLGHYFLMQSGYEMPFLTWVILMPLGGIITAVYSNRQNKKEKVKSYIDDVMKYVITAFLVSLSTVLLFMSKLELNTYPMVMMIYGIWLFVSGGALKFRPVIAGGIMNWIIGIGAFFVSFEIQLLFLAMSVLLGFIIPGYLLKRQYRQQTAATAH